MCDYSLFGLPTRLAVEGENVLSFQLSNGSVGLAPTSQAIAHNAWRKNGRIGNEPDICATCVPPGAQIEICCIPGIIREQYGLDVSQTVVFTQTSAEENQHRDAIKLLDGREIRLVELGPNIQFNIISLSSATEREQIAELAPIRTRRL